MPTTDFGAGAGESIKVAFIDKLRVGDRLEAHTVSGCTYTLDIKEVTEIGHNVLARVTKQQTEQRADATYIMQETCDYELRGCCQDVYTQTWGEPDAQKHRFIPVGMFLGTIALTRRICLARQNDPSFLSITSSVDAINIYRAPLGTGPSPE